MIRRCFSRYHNFRAIVKATDAVRLAEKSQKEFYDNQCGDDKIPYHLKVRILPTLTDAQRATIFEKAYHEDLVRQILDEGDYDEYIRG